MTHTATRCQHKGSICLAANIGGRVCTLTFVMGVINKGWGGECGPEQGLVRMAWVKSQGLDSEQGFGRSGLGKWPGFDQVAWVESQDLDKQQGYGSEERGVGTDLQGIQGPLHGLSLHLAQELHPCCHSLHAHTHRLWRPKQAGSQICLVKSVTKWLAGQASPAGLSSLLTRSTGTHRQILKTQASW